jgi:hypothetical protein
MKYMGKDFKIQVPQYIVRNEGITISNMSFVLLVKLIQIYYSQKKEIKSLTFEFYHKTIMYYLNIGENRTFKKYLYELYDAGLIVSEKVETLPPNENISITLSKKVIPEFNKGEMFTQLEGFVLNRLIIKKINYSGVRLLYYIKSYINYKKIGKEKAYPSETRMENDLKMTRKTIIELIKLLEKIKFIKVKRHPSTIESNINEYDQEIYTLKRLNNEYTIIHENIKKYIEKGKPTQQLEG